MREQANVPEDTLQWRPADPAHAARFDTAVEIEQYARQFIDIEVLRAAAERDEKARENERIKAAQKAQLEHTYDANSVGGKCVQAAIGKIKADVRILVEAYAKTDPKFKGVPVDPTAADLYIIPIGEEPMSGGKALMMKLAEAGRKVDAREREAEQRSKTATKNVAPDPRKK